MSEDLQKLAALRAARAEAESELANAQSRPSRFDRGPSSSAPGSSNTDHTATSEYLSSFTAPKELLNNVPIAEGEEAIHDPMAEHRTQSIAERNQGTYRGRAPTERVPSPVRLDPLTASSNASSSASGEHQTYAQVMAEREAERAAAKIAQEQAKAAQVAQQAAAAAAAAASTGKKRKRRWDVAASDGPSSSAAAAEAVSGSMGPPSIAVSSSSTSGSSSSMPPPATPPAKRQSRSRWDEPAPEAAAAAAAVAPTPMVISGAATPLHPGLGPEELMAARMEREMDERNRPLTDEDLDAILPSEGYKILAPPPGYAAPAMPALKATSAPAAGSTSAASGLYTMASGPEDAGQSRTELAASLGVVPDSVDPSLPAVKPEEYALFEPILADDRPDSALTKEEIVDRRILKLLLKIKNGTPQQRKVSLRTITDKAVDFGPAPLFKHILALLKSNQLEDQERHLMVKVIDRILYKLDSRVRPYVHNILVVIMPMLIETDYYARVEGREIISNLSKAAGLPTMLSVMRPDLGHANEYVRNVTARAFAVVASALGIPALLPFLKAVCKATRWEDRHTGVKIVQQIATLMGIAILPHLKGLIDAISPSLKDKESKIRTITALALASLAESAHPFGIESFDQVLKPLWNGIKVLKSKSLAAFLKAIGSIITLMDPEHADHYTRELMPYIVREFSTSDAEMKKIILKVIRQCVSTDGVAPAFIRDEIVPGLFKSFWVPRTALDSRAARALIETTHELAKRTGGAFVISRIVEGLKDEAEPYRLMVAECILTVVKDLGAADIDGRLETVLVDGLLYAFHEQGVATETSTIVSDTFAAVATALGQRAKPYLPQITSSLKWRLNNKAPKVRQQAADLIGRMAPVIHACGEHELLSHMSQILYEYLGEEFPEVLGSVIGALKAVVTVIGMEDMNPPVSDLLPRLTPILKNRHESVQENVINIIGRVADRGARHVPAREWMRICFELLDLLKAPKKAIRRAANATFGYIARAVGPQDVLATLLNNLKVQERQSRVCTTVAIGIVAEQSGPFTVLPALTNEYRVPESNVQNGVLKSLSFMFEYIGPLGASYVYAVTELLADALMDRDPVHRQTASAAVQHLALGVVGWGKEDALMHLLNLVWPNIFETSPHVIQAVMGAVDALRVALGPAIMLQYLLQGLFHPARKVRTVYWRIYNTTYVSGAHALVPAYPRLPVTEPEAEAGIDYARHELDIMM